MTSGRDEYLERTKKHIDYDKENERRNWWLNNTGGTAHDGLTVRDYFAAKAMAALMSQAYSKSIALESYYVADLMMKERNK